MAHVAGNEPNFDISSKKYDVQKSVPQKYKTAWALGLKQVRLAGELESSFKITLRIDKRV